MVRIITILILLASTSRLFGDTYPEVLFDNSIMGGSYAYSDVCYEGNSWVENVRGHLPVSDSLFFTPGNALSMKYTSAHQGTWDVTINYPDYNYSYQISNNDVLTFKLYVATETDKAALPKVSLLFDGVESLAIDIGNYIDDYGDNMWTNVSIPLRSISGLLPDATIKGVRFLKGQADGLTHHLFIDQIEFLPAAPPKEKLFSPAVLSAVKAFDKHVSLTWQLPLTPSIRYIKIYRSDDKKHFEPVSLRPIFVRNAIDIVPVSNKTYYYKVAWVDYDYVESPFSDVLEATVKTSTDDELLDFIQSASINYFVESAEVNSGMHSVSVRSTRDASISVKNTGFSILSHIVGVERGIVARPFAAARIQRILSFLDGAERYHGVFPAILDGRTGRGVYPTDTIAEVDLSATAFLVQGLLVAKQYFDGDTKVEEELREGIDALSGQVQWEHFLVSDTLPFLFDRWSPKVAFADAKPLGGYNACFVTYLMALSAQDHVVSTDAYSGGFALERFPADSNFVMAVIDNQVVSLDKTDGTADSTKPFFSYTPFTRDTLVYGLPIVLGSVDTSLMETIIPFLAFDLRGKRDEFADYFTNNTNLIKAYKRRDNERRVSDYSLDIWGTEYPKVTFSGGDYVLNPAIATATYAYQPDVALKSIRAFYEQYGHIVFTEYGFRSWVNLNENTVSHSFNPVNQAAVAIMIENGRSGLIWELFSKDEGIKSLNAILFSE